MRTDRRAASNATNVLGVIVLVLVLVLAGVVGAFAFGLVGAPSVVSSESRFGAVGADTTTIRTDVVVENPNPVGIDRENATIAHTIALNEIVVANDSRRGVALPPGISSRTLTTRLDNEKIPEWWVSHVANGERTVVEIDTRVRSPLLGESISVPRRRVVETDLLSSFNETETRPISADGPFRNSPVLYVNRTSATWGPVGETETPIAATFGVYNPLRVPIPITELGYTVRMNGIEVGNGTTDRTYVLESERVTEVETNVTIDATRLDEWWVTHLQRNQSTTVRVDFFLRADLPVVGTVRLPVDDLAYTTELETDLLGTKSGSANTEPNPSRHDEKRGAGVASESEKGAREAREERVSMP